MMMIMMVNDVIQTKPPLVNFSLMNHDIANKKYMKAMYYLGSAIDKKNILGKEIANQMITAMLIKKILLMKTE